MVETPPTTTPEKKTSFLDEVLQFTGLDRLVSKFKDAWNGIIAMTKMETSQLKSEVLQGQGSREVYDESQSLTLIDKVPGDKVAFSNKVKDIAKRLGINPNRIMAVIWKESHFDHTAKNKNGGAYGLIQWYPKRHPNLFPKITSMTALEQLEEVYKYLQPHASQIHSYEDTYMAVFQPSHLGKENTATMSQAVVKQNAVVDNNKDGLITVGEFKHVYAYEGLPSDTVEVLQQKAA